MSAPTLPSPYKTPSKSPSKCPTNINESDSTRRGGRGTDTGSAAVGVGTLSLSLSLSFPPLPFHTSHPWPNMVDQSIFCHDDHVITILRNLGIGHGFKRYYLYPLSTSFKGIMQQNSKCHSKVAET